MTVDAVQYISVISCHSIRVSANTLGVILKETVVSRLNVRVKRIIPGTVSKA